MTDSNANKTQMIKEHIVTKTIYTIELESKEQLRDLYSVLRCHGDSINTTDYHADNYYKNIRPSLYSFYKQLKEIFA